MSAYEKGLQDLSGLDLNAILNMFRVSDAGTQNERHYIKIDPEHGLQQTGFSMRAQGDKRVVAAESGKELLAGFVHLAAQTHELKPDDFPTLDEASAKEYLKGLQFEEADLLKRIHSRTQAFSFDDIRAIMTEAKHIGRKAWASKDEPPHVTFEKTKDGGAIISWQGHFTEGRTAIMEIAPDSEGRPANVKFSCHAGKNADGTNKDKSKFIAETFEHAFKALSKEIGAAQKPGLQKDFAAKAVDSRTGQWSLGGGVA